MQMPCNCIGVAVGTCSCGQKLVVPAAERPPRHDSVRKSLYLVDRKGKLKAPFTTFVENLYDTCAAYNIRHCPFQDVGQKGSVKSAMCDLCVLACFLIANTVVFLTIVTRAFMHTSSAMFSIAKWGIGKVRFETASPASTPTCSELFERQLSEPLL